MAGCLQQVDETTTATCPPQEECPALTPQDTPPGEFTAGKRLAPIVLEASDGTKDRIHGRYFDTVLKAECAFASPDGILPRVCLPDAAYTPTGWYADDTCTTPVAIVGACDTLPRFAKVAQQDGCYPTIVAFHELGAPLEQGVPLWNLQGDNCVKQSGAGPNSVALPMGAAMAWNDFVSGMITVQLPAN